MMNELKLALDLVHLHIYLYNPPCILHSEWSCDERSPRPPSPVNKKKKIQIIINK